MKIFTTQDNSQGQLSAGINASALPIVLKAGEGDLNFPVTINGSATSAGDKNTLNSTGIQALGVAVGDLIENVTDGSVCAIVSVSTNSITTTDLIGGSGNTWDNSDVWAINRFVVTLEARTTNASGVTTVTAREKVLIESRASGIDILTVNTSGRGFNGSTAQSFLTDDYVVLHSISLHHENLKELISEQARLIKTLQDNKADTSAVLALLQARNWKDPVKAATTANITLSTDVENGDTLDGVVLSTGDRILIKDQTLGENNGIYTVNASGSPTRATDFDAWSEVVSAAVIVEEGTANADAVYICTSDEGGTLGTTSIDFTVLPSQIATQGEAETGTENTKIMTALRVFQSIAANAKDNAGFSDSGIESQVTRTTAGTDTITISGLSFQPKYIKLHAALKFQSPTTAARFTTGTANFLATTLKSLQLLSENSTGGAYGAIMNSLNNFRAFYDATHYVELRVASITADGFTAEFQMVGDSGSTNSVDMSWEAYG